MSKDGGNTEPSIDDIVASIRRIISDEETKVRKPPSLSTPKNEDILELTEMLNDDGSVTPLPQAAASRANAKVEPPPVMPFGEVEEEAPIYAARPASDAPRFVERPAPMPADPKPMPSPQAAVTPQTPSPLPSSPPPPPPRPSDVGMAPQPQSPTPVRVAAPMNPNNPSVNSGVTLTPVSAPAAPPAGGLASPQAAGAAASAFDRLTQAALQQNAPPQPPRPSPIPGGAKSIEDLAREMLRPMLQQWLDANLPGMVERLVQQEIQRLTKR